MRPMGTTNEWKRISYGSFDRYKKMDIEISKHPLNNRIV